MSLNFRKVAEQKGVIQGGILANRTSAKLQSIMGEVVTIIGVQSAVGKLEGQISRYPAIIVKEYPDNYFKAGAGKIAQLISAWADECGCPLDVDAEEAGFSCVHKNYDALTDELQNQGGVRISFKMTHNDRTGRDFIDFTFVD